MLHMKARKRAVALGTTAALALMIPGADVASAHRFRASSRISLHYSDGAFKGKVTSGRRICENNRRVVVYKKRRGRDRVVGRDTTNSAGRFRIRERRARGRFYAVVSRRAFGRYGHMHICKGDTSNTIKRGRRGGGGGDDDDDNGGGDQ